MGKAPLYGTHKIVKARFRLFFLGQRPQNIPTFPVLARMRLGTVACPAAESINQTAERGHIVCFNCFDLYPKPPDSVQIKSLEKAI